MKKTRTRFLSILLTLCMAFALVPALGISAAAITLRDGAITGDGITGSVSYNSSTQTLTLNNATITADSTPISSAGSLTIELIGNNYITCTYEGDASMHGIYCPVLTFTGSGNLTASANDYGIFAYTSLTFNGTGTITGNGQTGISGGNKGATINSGTVIATGRDSDTLSCGFTTTGNLTVNGGSLTGTSGSASISNSKGVWVNNGNLILNGGTVKAISNDDKGIGCSVKGSSGNERFILNSGSLITSGGLRACNGLFAEPDKSDVHFYVADNISGTGKSEYFPETWPVELSDEYIEVTASTSTATPPATSTVSQTITFTDLDMPGKGKTLDTTATASDSGVTVSKVTYLMFNKTVDEVREGDPVTIGIYVTLKDGYAFPDNMKAILGGVYGNLASTNTIVPSVSSTTRAFTFELTVPGGEISSVQVSGIDAPTVGAAPDTTATVRGSNCTISSVAWSPAATAFANGNTYTATVTLKADGTKKFSSAPTATINGAAATIVSGAGTQELKISYTYPALNVNEVSYVDVTGIDAPVVGAKPDTSAGVVAGTCNIASISWEPADSTFVSGKTYSVLVSLEALDGTKFSSNPTVTINGSAATIVSGAGTQEMKISYTFPALKTYESITVSYNKTIAVAAIGETVTLSAATDLPEGATGIKYQWYKSSSNYLGTGTAISGATGASYTAPTADAGTAYYYCIVKATVNGKAVTSESGDGSIIKVTVANSAAAYVFPFTDVPTSAWYYESVRGAHSMGLINGKTTTLYKPDDNMTYAEAIKLAACMHQLYTEGEVTLENGSPWYKSYYDYCRDNGIINAAATASEPGYDELYALANTHITRETYVYIFSRSLPDEALAAQNTIPDGSIPDVPVTQGVWDDCIYKLYRAGILNGSDAKGTFNPQNNIKRSEVAAIVIRMMDATARVGAPAELGK